MIQTLDKEIISSLSLLGKEEKKNILGFIKSYLKLKEQSQHISIEQYNREIDEAGTRINAGNYFTQDEVEQEAAKW